MQKIKITGANFQNPGCAGAHPHTTQDPPLILRKINSINQKYI